MNDEYKEMVCRVRFRDGLPKEVYHKNWGDGYGNYTPPIKKEEGFCDWAKRKEE